MRPRYRVRSTPGEYRGPEERAGLAGRIGELVDEPFALINTSARATHTRASLAETLSGVLACVVLDASITVRLAAGR